MAIHLSGSVPVDRDAVCSVFREIRQSGGRVVVLKQDVDSSEHVLDQLLHQLGDDFEHLFTLAGNEFYEWTWGNQNGPHVATERGQ